MPRRTYRKKRGARRRRTAKPTGYAGYLSTAGKALALATKVATMVNAEKNFFDASTAITLTTTPQIFPLQLIAEGDDTQMRNGRSIKLAGLMMRSHWYPFTAATTSNLIRMVMFRDNYQAGTTPASTDILQTPITVDSFRNINTANPNRYTILMDRIVKLNPYGSTNTSAVVNKYFNIKSHVRYLGSTASTGQMGQGQIYFMCYADNVTGGNPVGALNIRTRYYDN